jgi:hypothetical protein
MLADVLAVLGGALIVAGVGLVSLPAALVVAGLLLTVTAWRLS